MVLFMETLLQGKRQTENLEAECCVLCQRVTNLTMSPQPTSSNYRMSIGSRVDDNNEEESITHMHREVDETDRDPQPSPL